MRRPGSVALLDELGRVRLVQSVSLRDFLHREIAYFCHIANIDAPELHLDGQYPVGLSPSSAIWGAR